MLMAYGACFCCNLNGARREGVKLTAGTGQCNTSREKGDLGQQRPGIQQHLLHLYAPKPNLTKWKRKEKGGKFITDKYPALKHAGTPPSPKGLVGEGSPS